LEESEKTEKYLRSINELDKKEMEEVRKHKKIAMEVDKLLK